MATPSLTNGEKLAQMMQNEALRRTIESSLEKNVSFLNNPLSIKSPNIIKGTLNEKPYFNP